MTVVRFECNITSLAPEETREVIHIVEGTQIQAEILEADSRHFKARILTPFHQVIEGRLPLFAVSMGGFTFVREGRATSLLVKSVSEALEKAFYEWTQREVEIADFLTNQEALVPVIGKYHQDAVETIRAMEDLVKVLQSRAEALHSEITAQQSELRREFKSGVISQTVYQTRLKVLREKGPGTGSAAALIAEAGALQKRFFTLKDRLVGLKESFSNGTGIEFAHAISLAGLGALQLGERDWKDPRDLLKGPSRAVYFLLRGPE